MPVLTELTETVNVHDPSAPPETAAGTVPPDKTTAAPLAGALTDPKPQVLLALGTAPIVTPVAKLRVTAAVFNEFRALL